MDVQLPPHLAKIAEEQLGETEESRRECIPKLRNMLESHMEEFEEIYKAPDDAFLLRFLRVSKFKVDKAYDRIKSYYEHRKKYKEDLSKTNVFEAISLFDLKIFQVMPQKTKNHQTVFYANLKHFVDYDQFSLEQLFRIGIFGGELVIDDDEALQIVGVKFLVNFSGVGMRHAFQCTPPYLYKLITCFLNILPMRIISIHYVNEPWFSKPLLKLIISMIPAKLKKRLSVHGSNYKSLQEHLELEVLPKELKGTGEEMEVEPFVKMALARNQERLKSDLENFDPNEDYEDTEENFPNQYIQKHYDVIKEFVKDDKQLTTLNNN